MSANGYVREIPPSRRHPRKRYQAVYRDAAGKQRSAGVHATKREAREALAHVTVSKVSGTWRDPAAGRRTVGDYAATWLASRQVAESTRVNVDKVLRCRVLPTFGHVALSGVEPVHVRAWAAQLAAQYAPTTVRDTVNTLKGLYDAAILDGLVALNPVVLRPGDLPKLTTGDPHFLTVTELEALTRATAQPYRAMVHLAAWTGMRYGECAGLSWDAVDLEHSAVHVRQALAAGEGGRPYLGPPKTPQSRRLVTLDAGTTAALLEHRVHATPNSQNLVFPNARGNLYAHSAFTRSVWQPAVEQAFHLTPLSTTCPQCNAPQNSECITRSGNRGSGKTHNARYGVDLPTFHDLRHSHVSHLLAAGMDPVTIAKRVGHSSPTLTTTTYAHLRHDHIQALNDAINVIKLRVLETSGS